jgi:hypothetical protein
LALTGPTVRKLHQPLIGKIQNRRNAGRSRSFSARDADPIQPNISKAALGLFYLSKKHTLSTIFGRDQNARGRTCGMRRKVVDVVLGYPRA